MTTIHQEYEENFDTLGAKGMVFYKFFTLLSAKGTTIRFGRRIVDDDVEPHVVNEFRSYLKEQREWIRMEHRSILEMKQRMWWVVENLIEHGVFSSSEQKNVMIWLDICLDQIA
jgi:hypothetical protein